LLAKKEVGDHARGRLKRSAVISDIQKGVTGGGDVRRLRVEGKIGMGNTTKEKRGKDSRTKGIVLYGRDGEEKRVQT